MLNDKNNKYLHQILSSQ